MLRLVHVAKRYISEQKEELKKQLVDEYNVEHPTLKELNLHSEEMRTGYCGKTEDVPEGCEDQSAGFCQDDRISECERVRKV